MATKTIPPGDATSKPGVAELPPPAVPKYIDGREVAAHRQPPSTAQLNEAADKFWSDPRPNLEQRVSALAATISTIKAAHKQRDSARGVKGAQRMLDKRDPDVMAKRDERDRLIREQSGNGKKVTDIAYDVVLNKNRNATEKQLENAAHLVRR